MEAQWWLPLQIRFVSHAHFSKQWFCWLQMHWSPALYFFSAYACYNCHLKLAQSHAHYCCRNSTTAVCQGIFMCSRLIACMKPLPPRFCVNQLTGSHTYQSIEIFTCLSWVHIARYLKRVVNTICSTVYQSGSHPGHQVIPVSSCDPVSMLTH